MDTEKQSRWKTNLALVIVGGIIVSFIAFFGWPAIKDALTPKQEIPKPNVYLTLSELDFTNLENLILENNKLTFETDIVAIDPLVLPFEVSIAGGLPPFDELEGYKNEGNFMLTLQNIGEGTATNITAYIELGSNNMIQDIDVDKPERVKIIEGGEDANFAKFLIDSLVSTERQRVDLFLMNNEIRKISGRTEETGSLQNVFHFKIIYRNVD